MSAAVRESFEAFDLDTPLSADEQVAAGVLKWQARLGAAGAGAQIPLQTIDDDPSPAADESADVVSVDEYNERYVYWNRCQALVALTKFEEGWTAFCELVLGPYVAKLALTNKNYKPFTDINGVFHNTDSDVAMILRTRADCAEEFVEFIKGSMEQAAAEPKPRLSQED